MDKINYVCDSLTILGNICDLVNENIEIINKKKEPMFYWIEKKEAYVNEIFNLEKTMDCEIEKIKKKDKLERDILDIQKKVKKLEKYNKIRDSSNFKFYKADYEEVIMSKLNTVNDLRVAYDQKRDLLEQINALEEKYIDSKYEKDIKLRNSELNEEILKCDKEIQLIENEVENFTESVMRKVIDDKCYLEKITEIKKTNINLDKYLNPKRLPEKLEIGTIRLDLKAVFSKKDFEINTNKMGELLNTNGQIELPFMYSRRNGFSLFVKANLDKWSEQLKKLILKQLVSFPAGKMELLMLDRSMSSFFSDFVSILRGADDKNIIGTKVWGENYEIAHQLSEARKRLATYIREYGNNHEENIAAREQRENFRMIVITGFPESLSVETLKDIKTIVKEGKKYGTYTLIQCDEKELERQMEIRERKEILDDIIESMDVVEEAGNRLYIVDKKNKYSFGIDFDYSLGDSELRTVLKSVAENIGSYDKIDLKLEDIGENILDENLWLTGSTKEGISIPIGRQGYDNVISVTLGRKGTAQKQDTRHHMLIEGATGAGKSNVLHTFIIPALLQYDPSELEIYYLDYKEAVEASVYSEYELPSFKILSINGERIFGLNTLKRLVSIMKERYSIFRNAQSGENTLDIEDYRKISTSNEMPRILLIIDELGCYLDVNDEITKESLALINDLAKQGRSAGIHMIFTAQSFNNLPIEIMDNMQIRIACSGSRLLLDGGGEAVDSAISAGYHAIFNDNGGNSQHNRAFRIVHINSKEQKMLLERISNIEKEIYEKEQGKNDRKIIYSSVEKNRVHPFNNLLSKDNPECRIYVGECFDFDKDFEIKFECKDRYNLLVVGNNISKLYRVLYYTCLSLVHYNCLTKIENYKQNIHIIDFGIDELEASNKVKTLENLFGSHIARYGIDDNSKDFEDVIENTKEMIDKLYKKITNDSYMNDGNKEFLIINGIDYWHLLNNGQQTSSNGSMDMLFETAEISTLEKIKKIIIEGPKKNIHCIVFVKEYEKGNYYLGNNFEDLFLFRIAFEQNEDVMRMLVMGSESGKMGNNGAVFFTPAKRDNRIIRIYDYPKEEWIRGYSEKQKNLSKEI